MVSLTDLAANPDLLIAFQRQQAAQRRLQQQQPPEIRTPSGVWMSALAQGLMNYQAAQADRRLEDLARQQRSEMDQERAEFGARLAAAGLGGGMGGAAPAMPAAPQAAPAALPNGAGGGMDESRRRYEAVPGRPAEGSAFRQPENDGPYRLDERGRPVIGPDGRPEENPWHALRGQLPPPSGRLGNVSGPAAAAPQAAGPNPALMQLALGATFSRNPEISRIAPLLMQQYERQQQDARLAQQNARDDQRFQLQLAAQARAEANANRETFGAPQTVMRDGREVLVQVGNRGTVREVTGLQAPQQLDEFGRLLQQAGVALGSPEGQQIARQILERRGQPPTTTIQNMPGDTAFERERGQTLAQEETALRNAGTQARQTLARIGEIERSLEQFQTGAMANASLTAGQIAQRLGVPDAMLERLGISRDQVAAGENIRSLSSQMLLGMIGPGGFPAQNFSNADREMLERALPSILNSPGGNRVIANVFRAQAQRQIDLSDSWNEWRRRNGTSADSLDRWMLEERPRIISRDVLAPILERAPQPSPAGAPSAAPSMGFALPGGGTAEPPAQAAPRGAPQPGTVMQGFRFRGGNPADRNNWEPVR